LERIPGFDTKPFPVQSYRGVRQLRWQAVLLQC